MKKMNVCVITSVCICIGLFSFLSNTQAVSAGDGKSELLKLAEKAIGQLGEAEEGLFEKVANGGIYEYRDKKKENNDPKNAGKWGNERVIRGRCVEWLCTDKEAMELVTYKGIQVIGLRIDEELDLQLVKAPFPLVFSKCSILSGINLQHAEIQMLSLEGSYIGRIRADGLEVEGDVLLRNGFYENGVRLVSATIRGQFVCRGSKFISSKETDEKPLDINSLKVLGSVYLDNGFKANGEVDLTNAIIEGQLNCIKGVFINPDGIALNCDALVVRKSVHLRDGFKAQGEVNLRGAVIGGQLSCADGKFIHPNKTALQCDSAKIAEIAFLNNHFMAEGKVNFVKAEIGGGLQWFNVDSPEKATLDLRLAKIGTWQDDKASSMVGNLFLDGFIYDEIASYNNDVKRRLEWIRRQYNLNNLKGQFRPQPYEQLAAVLRKSGHVNDAKKVLIAKNKDKARLTQLTWSELLWYRVFGPMIGFGYRPWRAFWIGIVLVLLGWLFFWAGYRAEVMTPTKEGADASGGFCAFVYSLDVFVPLVDLRQASYCMPNANLTGEVSISDKLKLTVSGKYLRYYLWFEVIAGWILTTLLVVGLTGLVRT